MIQTLHNGVQNLPEISETCLTQKNSPHGQIANISRHGDRTDLYAKIITIFSLVLLVIGAVVTYPDLVFMIECFHASSWVRTLLCISEILFFINLFAIIWRIILVRGYSPAKLCEEEKLPEITIVVPAYNESETVLDTLRSLAYSDYPSDRIHLIGVDDGSADDTWAWMQKAADELGNRVEIVHCPVNRGKRHALYEGFLRSRGEVIVTVDSDSLVNPQTLRHLVSPFIHDSRIGAVAGNVAVWNRTEGFIPRMLDVTFTYSFDFIRASQSRFNTVMCTPGALSAYRRDVVMQVLPEWISQKFFGRPANIGEDRAMTNMILRSGYHVVFEREAVVYTKVPTTYKKLCKMFLRWARSNVRETLIMTGFIFRNFRPTPKLGARVNLFLHWINLVVLQILRAQTMLCLLAAPIVFGIHLMLGATFVSIIPVIIYFLRYRNANGFWAIPYAFFWIVGIWWITPYAILTPYRTAWLTRQLPKEKTVQPLQCKAS